MVLNDPSSVALCPNLFFKKVEETERAENGEGEAWKEGK
jgi:hypothetical protein